MLTPFLIIGCLLTADPVSDAGLKTEVPKLVQSLDSEKAIERKGAEDRLILLGPPVLELMPAPDPQATDELSVRKRRIRDQIQKNQAAQSIEASTVTLHGRYKVSKLFAEIQSQTGNTITDLPRAAGAAIPDPEIAVNFDKTPFWTALDSVLDQTQLSIYPYGQPGALQVVPCGPNDLPRGGRADIAGPLRIEPVSVIAKRELRSSSPPLLQVSLEVAWEPRLRPIAIQQRMADLKVLDSSGGSLTADDSHAEPEVPVPSSSSAVEMDVALTMPQRPVKEIASLKGSLRAMILGKIETFRFDDLLIKAKQEKRIAAATVTLDEVRKNGDAWEVFVKLRYDDAGDALESHRNWALQNEAYLEDGNGKKIEPDSLETVSRNKNEIGVGYVFALAELPKNGAFVYKAPGMILTKDFPYEVRGVKMP